MTVSPGFLFPSGTTGLLFTAIFSIAGTTLLGGVSIRFQNGCSLSSSGNLCVQVANGTTSPVPESTQTGSFDNRDTTTLPYATLSTATTNLGQSLAGAPTHALPSVTYTATSQNGFNTTTTTTLNLAVTFNGTGIFRPTASLSLSAVDLFGVSQQTFTQTGSLGSTVPAGIYFATVTATYQTADTITFTTDSLSAAYSLPVTVTDYTLKTNASTISLQSPGSHPISVTVTPKAGFNTPVKLGLTIPAATSAAGISATYSTTTISGGSGTSTLTVSTTSNTPRGTFSITITSNSTLNGFTKTHTITLTIITVRPDFAISANPTTIVLPMPANGTLIQSSTITLTSFNFTGFVQLTTNVAPIGLGVILGTTSLLLPPNGQNHTTLTPVFLGNTPAGTYHVTVTGTAGSISHSTNVTFIVPSPPQGDFGINANPMFVSLTSGSASATSTITATSLNGFAGSVQLSASSSSPFALSLNRTQLTLTTGASASTMLIVTGLNLFPGTYFVSVTGTHTSNVNGTTVTISHSVLITVQVLAGPPDFQIFVNTSPTGTAMFAGTTLFFGVQVESAGPSGFNGTISLTARAIPVLVNGPVLSLNPTQVTLSIPGSQFGFSILTVSTTTLTPPGNYTIIIQGISGTLVHSAQFQLTVLPPPILTLSPSKGPVGTQVVVHGSGFLLPSSGPFFGPIQIEMTFDDQLVGLFFLRNSSFTFTFNVPESQSGIVHTIHAKTFFFFPNLDVQASFLVLPEPSALVVSVSSGTIYFRGDTATIFAMTSLNGQPTTLTSLQIILVKPDGSNATLATALVSPGVYKATFTIPTTGSIGTYAIIVRAHQAGSTDGAALGSFEVKPTWLQSNGHNILTATTIVGTMGAFGILGLAWKRGYFSRRKDDFSIL